MGNSESPRDRFPNLLKAQDFAGRRESTAMTFSVKETRNRRPPFPQTGAFHPDGGTRTRKPAAWVPLRTLVRPGRFHSSNFSGPFREKSRCGRKSHQLPLLRVAGQHPVGHQVYHTESVALSPENATCSGDSLNDVDSAVDDAKFLLQIAARPRLPESS